MQSSRSQGSKSLLEIVSGLTDRGTFIAHEDDLATPDPLGYPDYEVALAQARERSGSDESVVTGTAAIGGTEVELGLFVFPFLGGSMGEVAGERLARALERAAVDGRPFVLRTSTGGARMQEGMRALIQMPKVVAARLTLADARMPFVAVLAHPTTGGVLASLGGVADFTIAEADATIGFAGPRVVERFTRRPLAEGSHTSASAHEHGLVDAVVPPEEVAAAVANLLRLLTSDGSHAPPDRPVQVEAEVADPWDAVTRARSPDRATGRALLEELGEERFELRGDRAGAAGEGVVAAVARIGHRPVVALALDRDRPPGPAEFRKARRCIELAGRLELPVVTLIDTPGADPSEDSEARGIAWEIARLFEAVLGATVPVLSIVTGEGGSGGALAFAAGDAVIAYERSIFSVIGPESAAQILWRDENQAPRAARVLKLTAADLMKLGIADEVVADEEPLSKVVAYHLERLISSGRSPHEWTLERRRRWRNL